MLKIYFTWPRFQTPKASTPPRGSIVIGLVVALLVPSPGASFTQSSGGSVGNVVPMGHEWITRLAALELLGHDPIMKPDPHDPRAKWMQGKAKNPDISSREARSEVERIQRLKLADSRYESTYKPIYDAIIGERWVDLGGFNVAKAELPGNHNCFAAVAQEAAEVQYDHFMRRYDDRGGHGGVQAAERSSKRFVNYFVAAATAPPAQMQVWDGGAVSESVVVDRNYFLFGRALHLFQDAFSSEHTVRLPEDNYERIRQVKSYLCASGAEQHSHDFKAVLAYISGDVIWRIGTQFDSSWASYKPSNMKPAALVATEASKDLWAAFIRTMGLPLDRREAWARTEARQLVENWLSFDPEELESWYDDQYNRGATYVLTDGQSGNGQTVKECMRDLKVGTDDQLERVKELKRVQRICLYNVIPKTGYSDLFDTSMHMPYFWEWKDKFHFVKPPKDWKIPKRPADTGIRVQIKSVANKQPMIVPDGISNNNKVYCRSGKPIEFILVGNRAEAIFRLTDAPDLFLSYSNHYPSPVKLYHSSGRASYRLEKADMGWTILNNHYKQYMWLSNDQPRVTRGGKPRNTNAHWVIDGL